MAIHYGVDVGGTKIEFGVYDTQMNRLAVERTSTPTKNYSEFLAIFTSLINDADRHNDTQGTIGIGFPCFLDSQGLAVSSNISCINGKPLIQDLEDVLGRPFAYGNDCETFVLSEANSGLAKDYERVLGVIIGTGVNAKLSERGRLLTSNNKIAGEWGTSLISAMHQQKYQLPLRQCTSGRVGCLESYVSGPGLEWLYHHTSGKKLNAPSIVADMRSGDAIARTVFNQYLDILAYGIAQLILYYDPDVIVFGGGISKVTELYDALPSLITEYLLPGVVLPKLVAASYGDASGARGAAILGTDNLRQ